MNTIDIEQLEGKAQISVTVPIPLYIWAKGYSQNAGMTVSRFITQLIAEERARQQQTEPAPCSSN